MKHQIISTGDNSTSIYLPELDETYHSRKGAIAESEHVYIHAGLEVAAQNKNRIKIFEFGFGTGLNALLAWIYAENHSKTIYFDTVEKYPLPELIYQQLNYDEALNTNGKLLKMHEAAWNESIILSPQFILNKSEADIKDFAFPDNYYDVVFYDAFAPSKQAEVWDSSVLEKVEKSMVPEGILTTYCSQGAFKRTLIELGFAVEKIPGPPGKREMIRAYKRNKDLN